MPWKCGTTEIISDVTTTNQTPSALTVINVSVRYPGAPADAVVECSFAIAPGEHVALLGLNGSGKTSLLMGIAGLLQTSGEITVDGIRLTPGTMRSVRDRLGFLFSTPEDQLLFPCVLDDVAYGLLRMKVPKSEALQRAEKALDDLGVGKLAARDPYELSHGQKLRVALAGVLVTNPSLLLLDEATSALDPPGRRALTEILRVTASAFLFASHDIESVDRTCSRFLLMENGRLVSDTHSLDDIRNRIA